MNSRAAFALTVLFLINAMNFFDRQILGAVAEPVRRELQLTDAQLGWLGTAFTLLYAVVGVPLGRLADRANRARILAGGVFVWSLLTVSSGLARNFVQLFFMRLGVGIGEATCAPAASSLIGDLFPARQRARALSVFMLGLPVGLGLSFAVSGYIAQYYGWRWAFFVAGVPGILCAVACLFIREPERGATEEHAIGAQRRAGSPYLVVFSIPTVRWIIVSGALHNFNMYAIGAFLVPFLERVHGLTTVRAGLVAMIAYGFAGIPGLFVGGWLGDVARRARVNGRMIVGACSLFLSVPFVYLALQRAPGDTTFFLIFMTIGCSAMYVYYSTVYSTLHDVIEPSLRGTAMALYFCAMYLLGASLGPLGLGYISDFFTRRAALEAGMTNFSTEALAPYSSSGLHAAMYIVPVLSILLTIVLAAAARTVKGDVERLERWMRASSADHER